MASGGQLGGPAHGVVASVLMKGAGRVTAVNETTRQELRKLIAQAIEQGLSPAEAGDLVQAATAFSEYRAERIARTELMFAYNSAAIQSYGAYGVQEVQAIDGDEDEECAARNGQTFDLSEAESIEDHPNGTLDWIPVVGSEPVAPETPQEPEPQVVEPEPEPVQLPTFEEPIQPLTTEQLMAVAPRRELLSNIESGRWSLGDVAQHRWQVDLVREQGSRVSTLMDRAIASAVEDTRATGVRMRFRKLTLKSGDLGKDAAADMNSMNGEMRITRAAQDYTGKTYYRQYWLEDGYHQMDDFDALVKHELGHAVHFEMPRDLFAEWQRLYEVSQGAKGGDAARITKDLANTRQWLRESQGYLDRYLSYEGMTETELRDNGLTRELLAKRIEVSREMIARYEENIATLLRMRDEAKRAAKLLQAETLVTKYANKSMYEDFAETWVNYWTRPEWLKQHNPQRYDLIKRLVAFWKEHGVETPA